MNGLKILCFFLILTGTLFFFSLFTTTKAHSYPMGGCLGSTDVIVSEPRPDFNFSVQPGICRQIFYLVSYEDDLIIYAIKGNISNDGKKIENELLCLKGYQPVTDYEMCEPINLPSNTQSGIRGINNSWEIFTNKGVIKGEDHLYPYESSSSKPSSKPSSKMNFTIPITLLIIFLILLASYFILKRKYKLKKKP
jgi:hypothetical protein